MQDLYDKIRHYQLMAPFRLKGGWIPFFQAIIKNSGLSMNEISQLFDVSEASLFLCKCGGQSNMTKEQRAEYSWLLYNDQDKEARLERMKLRRNLPEALAYQKEQHKQYQKKYKTTNAERVKKKNKEYYSRPDIHQKHNEHMRQYMRKKKALQSNVSTDDSSKQQSDPTAMNSI